MLTMLVIHTVVIFALVSITCILAAVCWLGDIILPHKTKSWLKVFFEDLRN